MDANNSARQAEALACLLPALMRRLFTFDGDPVAELPLAQVRVCSILAEGPRPMSALGRELGVSLSATTQVADRLERAGLVERVASADDRRIKHLCLTALGSRTMRSHDETRIRRVKAVLERLSPDARQEVLQALETLMDACGTSEGRLVERASA